MAIILKNKTAEESAKVIFKDKQNVVEINSHSSPVSAIKKDGTVLKKHKFKLVLNGKEIPMDDKIEDLINNLLEKI